MPLTVSLLGPPRVKRDGDPVTFDTRKAMALLAHLALAERPRSREALTEFLWPGREIDHARGALRRTLSTLRKSIGPDRVETTRASIALARGGDLELDVRRFRRLLADDADEAALTEAVEFSRGAFMEGFSLRDSPEFDHWQIAEADALGRELSSALGRLVDLVAARGDFPRAIGHARRRLTLDPLNEPAHRQLVRLYAWSGDRAAALAQYRECVRTLSQELGVGPLAETTTLYEQLNEDAIDPPPAAGPTGGEPAARDRPSSQAPAVPTLPLVGRSAELDALLELHGGIEGDGRLAVIEGEAGIGKTRLAAEVLKRVRSEGATALEARCHEDEAAIPYGPVVDLLREAASRAEPSGRHDVPAVSLAEASRLLPQLSGRRPDVDVRHDDPGAAARLLQGVADVLGAACRGPVPGTIFIDDAHAADEATLDWITYVGRRLRSRPLLLLLSWRTEDVPPGHRLRRLVAEQVAAGVAQPSRLDADEVSELVGAAQAWAPGAEPDRAFAESEGLPLFVAEYLAAASSGQDVGQLSGGVRELLRARLGPVGETARQVLGAAAVIGRSFDLDTVRAAGGRGDDETVDALEELTRLGLVAESGDGARYDFSHGRLRALVYEDTSLARRRLLHRRVAEALEPGPAGDPAVIAYHYRLAGRDAQAAEHHRHAADAASSVHAHGDALGHLEAALALGHPDVAGLQERMGDHRTLLGEYAGALAAYEAAAAAVGPDALPAIEQKVAGVLQRRGDWERAEARLQAAFELAPEGSQAVRARIQADRSLNAHRDGRDDDAARLAEAARELAEGADDARALAQAHNMIAVLARSAGDLASAEAHLDRSIELAERIDDPPARAAALNNHALVSAQAGQPDRALELTREALELCVATGDRHREAALHNNLADLLHAAGRSDDSMAHLRRAVSLFSEIDADETTRQPEVWKLVDW